MAVTSNPGPGRSDAGGELQNRAQEMASGVKGVAKEKAADVREELRTRTSEAKEEVRGRVEEKRQVASEKVHALARALRAAGETLERDGEGMLARYGRQAADQVERLASYVDRNDTDGMVRQFETMARDNPAAFTGTTFAAGLFLGRFLRSSSSDDSDARRQWEDAGVTYGSGAESTTDAGMGDAGRTSGTESVTGTGFDTGARKFGSGAGHGSTGSGSTTGWTGPSGMPVDRTEQDLARHGDRPEGGTRNG